MSEHEFDVVVIGAGPVGEVAAGRVAERSDMSVAIVERELVGGECSYWACMPSKALLRPQELLREVTRVPGAAERITSTDPDVTAVLDRRDGIISHLDDSGQLPWLESRGIELFRGEGRLDGERRVRVGDDVLVAREAVIVATGSGAAVPPIPGLADADHWTNREITTTRDVPERLLVLGGGVVGVEMAQAWHSLGSEVVVVEGLDRLLPREEDVASEALAEAFEGMGIDVRTGIKAERVEGAAGEVKLHLEGGESVSGDRLLVAVGRRPHTDDLGLETVGLEPGGSIEVEDTLQVEDRPWLYAVGDVNARSLLTHMGKYQARIAGDHIIGTEVPLLSDGAQSPRVVFTDPQVAAVGHTTETAAEAGLEVRAIDLATSATAGASFYGRNAPGTTRFLVDEDRGVLAGVTFVGPEVADFLQAATIAVVAEVPLERLVHAVAPFPTRSELWLKFIEAVGL